jgi:glycosyltransferase involved in cell wall biosynthesis
MFLTDQKDILIADKPEEFARAVIDLYQSEDLWNRLSRNGLEKTKSLYSKRGCIPAVIEPLEQ